MPWYLDVLLNSIRPLVLNEFAVHTIHRETGKRLSTPDLLEAQGRDQAIHPNKGKGTSPLIAFPGTQDSASWPPLPPLQDFVQLVHQLRLLRRQVPFLPDSSRDEKCEDVSFLLLVDHSRYLINAYGPRGANG